MIRVAQIREAEEGCSSRCSMDAPVPVNRFVRSLAGTSFSSTMPLVPEPSPWWPKWLPPHISALGGTCLLVLLTCIISVGPILAISASKTQDLGSLLLKEVAQQQFNGMHTAIQAALDEGDYYMDFLDGWLRHVPLPLNASSLEFHLRNNMLAWISNVAKRIGGVCVAFVNDYSPRGGWQYCANRAEFDGVQDLYWNYMPNNTNMYQVKVDRHWNLLDIVDYWGAYKRKLAFEWEDGQMQWDAPWIWSEGRRNGSAITYTEVGQHRMVRIDGVPILNRFWMQDSDWAKLLQLNSDLLNSQNLEPPTAFLFDIAGTLITSTCGIINLKGKLISVNQSDCTVVREAYDQLLHTGHIDRGIGFIQSYLSVGTYLVGVRRIVTSKGDVTPYFLASAYPYASIDSPVRWALLLLIFASLVSFTFTTLAASLLTSRLIALPLRAVALDMDR